MSELRGFFVTGTDTGIGKSLVSAALLHKLVGEGVHARGMKPIASGCEATPDGLRNQDALLLQTHSWQPLDYSLHNPVSFDQPMAPHLLAPETGIDLQPLLPAAQSLAADAELLIIEGVGGWRVPLGPQTDVADLARLFGLPVLLVVGMRLGCINHALLSAAAIRADDLQLAGWIGSCVEPDMLQPQAVANSIQQHIGCPCLGQIPWLDPADPARAAENLVLS